LIGTGKSVKITLRNPYVAVSEGKTMLNGRQLAFQLTITTSAAVRGLPPFAATVVISDDVPPFAVTDVYNRR
jgi:hypothetical protein